MSNQESTRPDIADERMQDGQGRAQPTQLSLADLQRVSGGRAAVGDGFVLTERIRTTGFVLTE